MRARLERSYFIPKGVSQRVVVVAMLVSYIVHNILVRNTVRNNLRSVRNICTEQPVRADFGADSGAGFGVDFEPTPGSALGLILG